MFEGLFSNAGTCPLPCPLRPGVPLYVPPLADMANKVLIDWRLKNEWQSLMNFESRRESGGVSLASLVAGSETSRARVYTR